jgi:hypothetical protein
MGQSTHGIPYPVGTDRVMDGDNEMQAMSTFIDDAIYNVPRGRMYLAAATSGTLAPNVWTSFGTGLTYSYTKGGVVAVAPSQLRVPKDGLYHLEAQVYFNSAAGSGQGHRRGCRVHLNGSNTVSVIESIVGSIDPGAQPVACHAGGDVELHTNDTLALAFWHDQTGANLTALGTGSPGSYTYMSLFWVAAL